MKQQINTPNEELKLSQIPISPTVNQFSTILLSIIAGISLATAVFFGYQYFQIKKTATVTQTGAQSSTPTPASTTTPSDWKTFRSANNEVQLSYPADFKVREKTDTSLVIDNHLPSDPDCKVGGCHIGIRRLVVFLNIVENSQPLAAFVESEHQQSLNLASDTTPVTPKTIASNNALFYGSGGDGYYHNYYLEINQNQKLHISIGHPKRDDSTYTEIANQILNTLIIN